MALTYVVRKPLPCNIYPSITHKAPLYVRRKLVPYLISSNFTVGSLGGAAMLLFGGERKGGATILAAKVYLAGFSIRKVLERGRDKP